MKKNLSEEILKLKLLKLEQLESERKHRESLPSLYGLPLYQWQDSYIKAKFTHKKRLICAANQIGKSTIQIRDRINIATDKSLWPLLWPEFSRVHGDFTPYSWYLYPNRDTVSTEFFEKWIPYYLPKDKDDPVYGWKEVIKNKEVKGVEFKSGYTLYFKTYNQDVHDLQSGTVFAIDCDEELPEELLSELEARLFATDGHFSMVFTATIGQELWRRCIEPRSPSEEFWPQAFKRQVSMYDCLKYADGSATPWTEQRIRSLEANMKSRNEVLKRVYGKFIKDTGLMFKGFDRERNFRPFPKVGNQYFKGCPKGWHIYSGIDLGSGGSENHPTAYSFLAVSPDFKKIRWIRGRRLDGIETTNADSLVYYKKTRGSLIPNIQSYDHAAKDFGLIALSSGEVFEHAKKARDAGIAALNAAFKTGMFVIYYDPEDPEDEAIKLVGELESLDETTPKTKAKDDFIDSVKYAMMSIPINWEDVINGKQVEAPKEKPKQGTVEAARPRDYWERNEDEKADEDNYKSELEFWGGLYDSDGVD